MPVHTLNELYRQAVDSLPRDDMFRHKHGGRWVDISSQEFRQAVTEASQGLASLGIQPGDRVALLSENRVEWAMLDMAILTAGAVVVPIYPTLLPHHIEYILRDCQPTAVISSTPEQSEKLGRLGGSVDSIRHHISMEPVNLADVITVKKLRELGAVHQRQQPEDAERRLVAVDPDDLATIIYTSGTTGDPKGVMLTHKNIVTNVLNVLQVLKIGGNDSCLSFLPLSHIFERMAGYYTMMHAGASIAYAESIETVSTNLLEVRPTVMIAVPRLYEKIYARVINTASSGGSLKRSIFFKAKAAGAEYAAVAVEGKSVSLGLRLRMGVADALVFRKLRAKTGGRLQFFVSGGAPLAQEIAEFFFAAKLPIMEGYGLTETSPVIAVNTFEHFRPGTVGRPIPGIEMKFADDGEILTRSDCVMKGYHGQAEATEDCIIDGWFHTGDIGEMDADGFLRITDRKKDILVTAGGKNVAPQPMENDLKLSKYVAEAVVIGDRRKYLTALIVPNFEAVLELAQRGGVAHEDNDKLLAAPLIQREFQNLIDVVNERRSSFEQIKYFRLVSRDFTLEGGELTPSLKVKRKVVGEKYGELIESMYVDA